MSFPSSSNEREGPNAGSVEDLLRIQRDLALALGSTSDFTEALDLVLEATMQTGGIDSGGIYLLDESSGGLCLVVHRGVSPRFAEAVRRYPSDGPHTQVVLRGEPFYANARDEGGNGVPEVLREGLKAIAVLPSRHEGRVVAVVNLASHTADEIAPATRHALEAIAAQIGPVLARMRTEVSLRESLAREVAERREAAASLEKEQQLLRKLLNQQDTERRLLGYEIHDGCAQQLTGALLHFQAFRQILPQQPDEAWRAFTTGTGLLEEGIAEVRRLIGGLRPPILDESGAVAAIEYLVFQIRRREQPEIQLSTQVTFDRLAPQLENTLFRAVQEALRNACRHSDSPRIAVRLWNDAEHVWAEVRDWGKGFAPADVPEGRFGLQGIRERARLMKGRATIHSTPGQGTQVLIELPREA